MILINKIVKVTSKRNFYDFVNQYVIFLFCFVLFLFLSFFFFFFFLRMINCLYYWGQIFSERCDDSFVNYGIHNQKLCDLMR